MSSSRVALYAEADGRPPGEALILEHLPLVKRVALHLRARVPRFVEFDELVQSGMIGLIEAARSFDATKGVKFESYAHIRIKGAMLDEVRRVSYLPRSAVAINRSHAESTSALATDLGRTPTQAELAEYMGKEADEVHKERAEALRFETTSIETLPEVVENLPAEDSARPDVQVEHAEFMEALQDAISRLPEREQLIVQLYYVEEMTLREIGATIDVTEARVSQILSSVAKNLRAILQVSSR